jgi:branched-chain amino acid aminotransferase
VGAGVTEPLAWVDGALLPAADATVAATDRGLLLGEGVFDTVLAVDGVPLAPTRHLARLRRSAAALDLPVPHDDETLATALRAVAATAPGQARVRITVTAATVLVGAFPVEQRGPTSTVVTSPWPINERSPLAGVKHTSRAELVRAIGYAQARGGDEALMGTTDGHLSEGTGANVFVVLDGELVTPSLRSGCLAGVTRELVIELVGACEADIPMPALGSVEEAFLTSSTRGVHPIGRLDGRTFEVGERTRVAASAYADLVARTSDP